MDQGYISGIYFTSILQILEEMGLPLSDSLSIAGLKSTQINSPKSRIHMDKFADVLDEASVALGEPNIGLQVGYRFRVHTFVESGSILIYCSTIAQAIEVNALYEPLTETIGQSVLQRDKGESRAIWEEIFSDHERYRHVTELIMAGYATTTNWLSWGFEPGVKAVTFRHSQPKNMVGYAQVFGENITFDSPQNSILINEAVIDQSLPTANAEKLAQIRHKLDEVMEKANNKSGLKERVAAVVHQGIKDHNVSFDHVSREIGIRARTLRRMLQEEGLSYREILTGVRKSLCLGYMQDNYNFTEIAQLLAYNDQSAFTRAFKGWYGVKPSDYRHEIIQI